MSDLAKEILFLEASVMLRSWVEIRLYSKCALFTATSYIVFDIVLLFQYGRGHGTLYMWYIFTSLLGLHKIVECLQVGLQILKIPVDLNVPYCCETQK